MNFSIYEFTGEATSDVLSRLLQLTDELPVPFRQRFSYSEYCQWVTKLLDNGHLFLAKNTDGVVVGCLGLYSNNPSEGAYLSLLACDRQVWGIGVGRALLCHAFQFCLGQGMKGITLSVDKRNTRAISFYQRNHFSIVKRDVGNYLMRRGTNEV